ncbi:hypothetical protein SVAN01_01970 [Stagonosporopsis vannaccii]|nr:hypothetical protein SVAN01_01970 [Stagonosporopsis vannaccii]
MPDPEWNAEHGKWLQKRWDGGQQRYYWKHHDATTNDWVFFAWCPLRPDSGVFPGAQATQGVNIAAVACSNETTPSSNGAIAAPQQEQSILPRGLGRDIHGLGTSGNRRVDPSFSVRHRSFFVEGRVFSVIMNETAGSTTAATDYNTSRSLNPVIYEDNWVYTNVRRFVVVRPRREFCFACPIFTYGGRATTKHGVHAREHAIVYTSGYSPQLLPGEAGITKTSICVVMTDNNPALNEASRIYFGIHHPIQYNVKVKEIGYVHPEWIPHLIGNWKEEDGGDGSQQEPEVTASAHQDYDESGYPGHYRRY